MSSSESKRKRKLLRRAAELKREVTKHRMVMALLAVVCAGGVIVYFTALFKGLISNNPFEQVICIVIAIFVGLLSVKATQSNRRFEAYLRETGLTKDEVRAFMKESDSQ